MEDTKRELLFDIEQEFADSMRSKDVEGENTKDTKGINKEIDSGSFQNAKNVIYELITKYIEMIQPILNAADSFRKTAIMVLKRFIELTKPLRAVGLLSDNQFVVWEYPTQDFVEELVNSTNVDKTLRLIYEKEKYSSVIDIAKKCSESPILQNNKRLFDQAIKAFKKGDTDLAILGITATLDGTLSNISGNTTTSFYKRAEALIDKLKSAESLMTLGEEEYSVIILAISLDRTLQSFIARSDFNGKEPKSLNRHWIMHGRSSKRKTKLDCVKLIRLLYGLIIIYNLSTSDNNA